ncbi:hypothetical protein F5Y07DRAFT_391210 [Xylaria sp. FL0933]|nr:hypothetical protein F5Y07DRAFT_391210 [Xylaria sp. FL0933]
MPDLSIISALFLVAVISVIALWQKSGRHDKTIPGEKGEKIRKLQSFAAYHDVAASLATLINRDGAGDWPPRTSYKSWPTALLPYQKILLEVLPSLATEAPLLDVASDIKRRERFRRFMERLLHENVHLPSAIKVLDEIKTDKWDHLSRDQLNGFFCCIALSRHAYRWAITPVVKVAQLERTVDLPVELSLPWPYLQRHFGFAADSGIHTSNVLLNFNEDGVRAFTFNSTLPAVIQSTEEAFFRLLYDTETMGFDAFYEVVMATTSFREGRSISCLESMRKINITLRQVLHLFSAQMREAHISRKYWLSYVQGFHGWSAGRQVNGKLVRFNGVSGNHILLFQVLDAFVGMEQYLGEEDMTLYIPLQQRLFCRAVKKHCFRRQLGDSDTEIAQEFEQIAKILRSYRAAHRSRIMPYLRQPAPERFHMTAGKSVLTTDANVIIDEAIAPLEEMLVRRLNATK